MVSAKGKEKVTDYGGKGKRKRSTGGDGVDDDKTGRKRKDRGVLKFFDDEAYHAEEEEDSSDGSSYDSEDLDDIIGSDFNANNVHGKSPPLPQVKEEEMSEEEYDRQMAERYKPGASFVTYAEDGCDKKNSFDSDVYVPSANDPKIWKVKCMVGRERYSALCLMQKYADLAHLGIKLQIVSACALDHLKGFIIIEAETQNDIYEACKGLSTIYTSKVTAVPSNEISRLISVRSKSSAISEGMWARVKSGRYKGDLAQVVAVNNERKKVTAKLIPRIDLTSLAEKFIFSSQNTATDIAYHSGGGVVSPCSVESLMEFMRSSPFERPLETPVPGPNPVVGSCNGLVCIYSWDDAAFILFNPSMKIYNILPKIEYEDLRHYIINFGFGWDESSDDYKVVAFLFIPFNHRRSVCKVYSSKANSWKTVEIPGFDFIFSFRSHTAGKFLHGKLHWYLDSNEIVCFDLKSERIGMIECPDVHDNLRLLLSLGVVAGCLVLITREDNPDVCVMKEYGVKESWQILSHVTELLIPPFSAQFVVPPNSQTEIMLYD